MVILDQERCDIFLYLQIRKLFVFTARFCCLVNGISLLTADCFCLLSILFLIILSLFFVYFVSS